ncbi:unnamed protein product [Amoebophrya sp. A25]|nr:unnamed protein product [Amoebophrya sp. A25]|eukprot:GSA25T00015239001.1
MAMLANQADDFEFLIRQTENTLMSMLRASKREAFEHSQENAQKALETTMRAQRNARLHSLFSGWYRQYMQGKVSEKEHYWKLQVAALKSKSSLGLQRAMGAISEKSSQAAVKFIFEAWKEERTRSFQDKYRKLLYETKHRGAAQMKRILTHMCGNNNLVFARTIFIAWKDLIQAMLKQRREQSWKSSVAELQHRSRNAMLQRTLAMFDLQDDALVKNFFMAWKDNWVEERLVRQKASWLQDNRTLRERFAESIKQRIYMQCYTQHSLLMKHVYTLWKDVSVRARVLRMEESLKHARFDNEGLGVKLQEQKLKANGAVKRSLMAMLGSQSELIKQTVFGAWMSDYNDGRLRRQREVALKFQEGEKKWKGSMSALLKNHDELILKHIFETWRRIAAESHCQRAREHAAQQKIRESKRFQQALISMLDSQQHLFFQQVFNLWKELGQDRLARRKEQEAYEKSKHDYKIANSQRMNEVVTRMIGNREELMAEHVFKNWNKYALSQQASRWQRKYNDETSKLRAKSLTAVKKAMLMMFDGKLEMLVRQVFRGWTEMMQESKSKRQEETAKKQMRIQASENMKRTMLSFLQANEQVLQQTTFAAWKDRYVAKQLGKMENVKRAFKDVREKALLNGARACEVTVYWENNYIAKSYFTAWKDQCVSSCWRNSLAKWRDTFTALEHKVKQEATAKPTTVEQKLSCAEFELKGLFDALLKTHGLTHRDFSSKDEMKEWVDSQVGFKSQLIVQPGKRDKENNPYFGMATDHFKEVLGTSPNFSTRTRKGHVLC